MDKIKELKEQLQTEIRKERLKTLKSLEKTTGFKVGDIVEFINRERINDYDYEEHWNKREIIDFEESGGIIRVNLKGWYGAIQVKGIRKFNPDDYTLRHQLWERELDIDDEFQLVVEKPKSTKGKLYKVLSVLKQKDESIEYSYWNDYGKKAYLYEGEFHVTTPK